MRIATTAILALLASTTSPLLAQSAIGTIARGNYVCELPGNAAGAAGIAQPGESFSIESASRYSTAEGTGTYLRTGNRLQMTSGPRNGDAYQVINREFLRKLDQQGQPTSLRCVRASR
jgi:hypothetical protein